MNCVGYKYSIETLFMLIVTSVGEKCREDREYEAGDCDRCEH